MKDTIAGKGVHQKLADRLVIARDQAKKLRHGTR